MKKLFLSIGLLAAVACNDKKQKLPTLPTLVSGTTHIDITDSIRTTVLFAMNTREFKAKIFYQPRMVDTFEPANDDSTLFRPIRMKVYDKLYFLHVIDTAIEKGIRRPIDTFVQVNSKFVIEDLNKKW